MSFCILFVFFVVTLTSSYITALVCRRAMPQISISRTVITSSICVGTRLVTHTFLV